MNSISDIASLSGAPRWYDADLPFFYAYFVIAFFIALFLISKAKPKYPFELFVLLFYLMTGNANEILTLDLGVIDIQPARAIFLVFGWFLFRQIFYSKENPFPQSQWRMPWFQVMLIAYVIMLTASQISHIGGELKPMKVLTNAIENTNFLVVIYALSLMINKKTIELVAKVMIVTSIFSGLIGFAQILYAPLFTRL